MDIPSKRLPPAYATVTLIQYPEGHATGFFYISESEDLYLITNRHVVFDITPSEIHCPNEIRILLRDRPNLANVSFHDIPLYSESGNPVWLSHPDDSSIDVVAIPLEIDFEKYGNIAVSKKYFLPNDIFLDAGEQAMIIGYPIKGARPYLPMARSALISSPYGVRFQGKPCFATDANMHSGTSGSPVFMMPSKTYLTTDDRHELVTFDSPKPFLLGVHSATILSQNETKEGPLNLNLTWYPQLIEEILI